MLPSNLWPFLFIPLVSCLVSAQGPVQTLFPAAVPLAVKTPYMNVWYESVANSSPLPNSWPQFWNMTANMGWSGKIRVNGTTYKWMGADSGTGTAANVTNIQITPTRSIFIMQAGPMNVTVTFLSPVEPDDWVKQSIPFSYVSVEAQSLDGNSYPVQVYSDITAEWASGDRSSQVLWSTSNTDTGKAMYHEIQLQNPQKYTEVSNQAQDGVVYYAISTSQPSLTWQIDLDSTVRSGFQTNGVLGNSQSSAFAPISPNLTVFALAVNLGAIQSTASPVTFSVGYVRDPAIAYTVPGGTLQERRPYYTTQFPNIRSVAMPNQGVEQSGNMLIMELAHTRISGNLTLLSQYYDTSKRWADYLVSTALKSQNQTNQDGGSADLANIALKGIIGVRAMAEIARAVGRGSDVTEYGNQASSLLSSWLSLATSSGGSSHLLGSYGNQQSWSSMYNLFADKMLGLNFVSQSASIESVFDMQTQYLKSLLANAPAPSWGLPIDNENAPFGNTAWTLFASAFVSNTTVRDTLINGVHNHANSNVSVGVFPEIYDTSDNSPRNGFASPAIGGVFSHLVLTVPNQTFSGDQAGGQPNDGSRSSSHIGAIVGGVIGGLAIVGIAVAIAVICLRKRHRWRRQYEARDITETAERAPLPQPESMPHEVRPDLDATPSDAKAILTGTEADDMGAFQGLFPVQPMKAGGDETPGREPQSALSEAAATSSNIGSQTGSAWSRDLLSQMGSISTTDMVGLRAEVEGLRRVMQVIREERLAPPPEYVE